MAVVIWHNPKCTTSCKVLAMIRAEGIEPEIIEYVKTPPSGPEIKAVLTEMGMKPRELLRRNATPYDELGLDDETLSDAALVATMPSIPC